MIEKEKISELLCSNFIFKEISTERLHELVEQSVIITFENEEIIFQEGDIGDACYVILSGTVNIITEADDGREIHLARLETGSCFGEQALVSTHKKRSATALANETSRLLQVSQKNFQHLLQQNPNIVRHLELRGKEQLREKLLQQSSVLRPLSTLFTEKNQNDLKEESFQPDEIVFKEGEPGQRFYLITEGSAKVVKNVEGQDKIVGRLQSGRYFGELALMRNAPRSATVIAESLLKVISISGERFLALYEQSPQLKMQMECLSGFYSLPNTDSLLSLHANQFTDKDSLTAVFYQPTGTVTTTRVLDEAIISSSRTDIDLTKHPSTIWKNEQHIRELFFDDQRLAGFIVIGEWADLGRLQQALIQHQRFSSRQLALFRLRGELWLEPEQENFKDKTVVCHCTGVSRGQLNRATAEGCHSVSCLSQKTGASLVCGSCAPSLAKIVGSSDTEDAHLIGIIPVTREIKSFRFRPTQSSVIPYPPGQHIRIEAKINGRWIQRAYTLTSPCRQQDYYEITVKREEKGLMSRWLHDELTEHSEIRLSTPQGHFHIDPEQTQSMVCFAGGIGITPMLSILRGLPQQTKLHIDYSISNAEQIVYRNELKQATQQDDVTIQFRISQETGRIQAENITAIVNDYPEAQFYICGSKSYEQTIVNHLKQNNVNESSIKVEQFMPPSASLAPKGLTGLLNSSILALCLLVLFALPTFPARTSVQALDLTFLWTDSFWQQLSGYSVLTAGLLSLVISLRKRIKKIQFLNYGWWRLFHAGIGVLITLLLIVHTGLSVGDNFNFWLMLSFICILTIGTLIGVLTFIENRRPHDLIHKTKHQLQRLHIIIGYPLPALLVIHILSSYYF